MEKELNFQVPNQNFNFPVTIHIKPLSVNEAWQGKRYKTPLYKVYEKELLLKLPSFFQVPSGDIRIELQFGLSNILSDFDNPVKPFIDVLQKKYKFNDRFIQEATIKKFKTPKGMEWIRFEIEPM